MKAILTRDDVSQAIDKLKAAGKKTTLAAIHAALENRGSISTLVRLKGEIEAGAVQVKDDESGLQAFREIWAQAAEVGRKAKEAEVAELQEALEATAEEAEKAAGETLAAKERLAAVEAQRDALISDLAAAQSALTHARAEGAGHAEKIAEKMERIASLQEAHAAALAQAGAELRAEHDRAHKLEIELAKLQAISEIKPKK